MKCARCSADLLDDSRYCSKCGTAASSPGGDPATATVTTFKPAPEYTPGTILDGRFRIVEMLGRGGMGVVYKAEDTKLHRPVALKFLSAGFAERPDARARFMLEARAAAALSHPAICTIYEIHDEGSQPYIELEYVPGESLRARVKGGPLEVAEAAAIALQIAEGLEEAHQKGIVHRDIKSSNIMISGKGQAKIMDFGLAKVSGETLYTREGTTLGTAAYMSPEQVRGGDLDRRTDIWSLGVVLYEMLAGRVPFAGEPEASLLYAIVHEHPHPLNQARPDIPGELQHIVNRALKKDPDARYASAAEMARDLNGYLAGLRREAENAVTLGAVLRRARKPKIAVPVAVCLIALAAAGVWFGHRQSRIRWARERAIPEIERLVLSTELGLANLSKAYALASEAEKYIPGDPALSGWLARCSVSIGINTEPPGAEVYLQEPWNSGGQWRLLGVSPIRKIRLPRSFFWWKFQKQGYQTVQAVAPTAVWRDPGQDLFRILDPQGKIPPGMVRVAGGKKPVGQFPDFFIDQYEVTNKQYNEFIGAGGYRERKYWKQPFVRAGKTIGWEQAIAEFVDQTGRPGPSTWQAGDYPKGQDDYPVSGISWYEAAAYAEYAGKSLPTAPQWAIAAGLGSPVFAQSAYGWISQLSNYKGEGPAAVGSLRSMTAYGAYDMPGNVREWCWNETKDGRAIRGGAWNDASYMLNNVSQAPPFDRSPKNGFRCAVYDAAKLPAAALGPFRDTEPTLDWAREKPVSDAVFAAYREQFAYDNKELNAKVESRKDNSADWIQEKVTISAAYGNETLPIHVFLPRHASRPYQVVVYFPGTGSQAQLSSEDVEHYREFEMFLSFLPKNGRAVLYPVYQSTFERRGERLMAIQPGTREHTEFNIQLVKDFKRCLEYVQTRADLDPRKIAFLGYSWGGRVAPLLLAGEDRVRASILMVGGQSGGFRPETRAVHYLPRVKVPTLMLNGRYDMTFPYENAVKPMFDLLGTAPEHKRLILYDTDHFVPRNELIKEGLAWLDRYLGPVK